MSKICTKCGEEKLFEEFYRDRNSKSGLIAKCKECRNIVVRAYSKRTNYTSSKKYAKTDRGKQTRKKAWQKYNRSEHGKKRNRQIKTESIGQYLKYRLANVRAQGKKNIDINLEYLLDLYHSQFGRCSISKIHMTHSFYDLKCVSIDRINSSKGYIKGNIQLVCRAINLGKQNLPNQDMIDFISEVIKNG